MIPEAEVFLGQIGYAKYATPGSPAVAEEVARVAVDHYSVIMENHGVIVWARMSRMPSGRWRTPTPTAR